jgi:hypothetical protein
MKFFRIVYLPFFLLYFSVSECRCSAAEASAGIDSLAKKGVQIKRDTSKNISELWIYDKVNLTIDDFHTIKEMPELKTLFMRQISRQLDDELLGLLGPMTSVETLYTNMATISDDGMKSLAKWTNLKQLNLIHWGWANGWRQFPNQSTKIGQGLSHLATLPHLKSLDLGGSRIDDSALAAVTAIKTLEELRLFHAVAVSDAGIPGLATLPKLRVVQFGSPRISDLALEHLSKITTLTHIEMDETWLTYANGFRYLKALPHLSRIILKNVITDEVDIAALKADHPQAQIEWTKPDEKMLTKLVAEKAKFDKDLLRMKVQQ